MEGTRVDSIVCSALAAGYIIAAGDVRPPSSNPEYPEVPSRHVDSRQLLSSTHIAPGADPYLQSITYATGGTLTLLALVPGKSSLNAKSRLISLYSSSIICHFI